MIYFIYLFLALFSLLLPLKSSAFCPLCVISTGALAGLFRWLGVDDAIIGLWFGAFVTSSGIVINKFLLKRQIKIKFQLFLILLGAYVLFVNVFYWGGTFVSYNKILGVNKIIFGTIFGNLLFLSTIYFDKFLRRQNQSKIFISHQKVIIAIGLLLIFSLFFYFLIK